jgi:hypothetical protein
LGCSLKQPVDLLLFVYFGEKNRTYREAYALDETQSQFYRYENPSQFCRCFLLLVVVFTLQWINQEQEPNISRRLKVEFGSWVLGPSSQT